jgi:hypothetical protein
MDGGDIILYISGIVATDVFSGSIEQSCPGNRGQG